MQAILKTRREVGFEIGEVTEPLISNPTDVKLRVDAVSICGTDVHIYNYDEWAHKRITPPFIAGHELGATVVEKGSRVKELAVGDKVSIECHITCGTCYQCTSDRKHVCRYYEVIGVDRDGVFTENVVVPSDNVWKNNPDLPPELASLQDPLGNAVHTLIPMGLIEDIAGKNVAVIGCGPIGLMSIAVAHELGAGQIIATGGGSNLLRLEMAKDMGARIVLNTREDGDRIVKEILDATDGNGVDVMLEMSGSPQGLRQGLEVLTPGGRASLLGFGKPLELDVSRLIVSKALTIYGIAGRRMYQTWQQMKGLLKREVLREKLKKLITHRYRMDDYQRGIDVLNAKKAIKVVMDPFT